MLTGNKEKKGAKDEGETDGPLAQAMVFLFGASSSWWNKSSRKAGEKKGCGRGWREHGCSEGVAERGTPVVKGLGKCGRSHAYVRPCSPRRGRIKHGWDQKRAGTGRSRGCTRKAG